MNAVLYKIVELIARLHTFIMGLNNAYETSFSDKELHFIVLGVIGMLLVFVVHPFFKWLARNGHELVITWFYVFTVLVVISFAIEIGQKVTGTGSMEFADIMFGLCGFMFFFIIYAILRMIVLGIIHLIGKFR